MKIAHLADIQIRFGSRHSEFREVFKRLHKDLKDLKPDRIVVAGDINHHKINISPGSFELFSELLIGLANIAPTDIILGNHDLNLQQLEQGDSISPIFTLVNLIQKDKKVAYVINPENKDSMDYSQNAIYFYPDSGFYKLTDNLVYGVYSMKDNQLLKLEEKESGVNYIALYHGQIHGARGDNGHIINGDNLVGVNTFNNFDIVMLGDIHEYQTFREDETMAYPGSLIQQNYGESIDKGYILWDIENKTHVRKFIPNDFGFAKVTIAKGEKFDERIEHIKFSSNKKKTKVYVVWEDYEENFSQEKENQIIKLIKDKHGCEVVKVQFETLIKDVVVTEEKEEVYKESEEYLKEFVETGSFECTKEEIKDLLELHRDTNEKLELTEDIKVSVEWSLDKMEISNIFSFPVKATTIPYERLRGITGVFGKNYNGKSNFIKALVWGLYKEILGGGDPRFLTNIYTDSNKGYVKIWLTIDGKKYYIERFVKTTRKKDGSTSNSYGILYKTLEFEYDDEGNLDSEKWENEKSDDKTAEKNEVAKLVENAIGTFDDFTKVSLQTQGGKDDYLSMQQQPKNTLIGRYLGLEPYKLRYEYRKDYFNDIKKKQKELGDKVVIEEEISQLRQQKETRTEDHASVLKEKEDFAEKKDKVDKQVLELTKQLEKLEAVAINDKATVQKQIDNFKTEISTKQKEVEGLVEWLSINFIKELPYSLSDAEKLSQELVSESNKKIEFQSQLNVVEKTLSLNPIQEEINIDGFEEDVDRIKKDISQLEAQLITYKGNKCPTCGHIHQKADPSKEDECSDDIIRKKELLKFKQDKVKESERVKTNNQNFQNNLSKKANLKQAISLSEDKIADIVKKQEVISNSQHIVEHNTSVESNTANLNSSKNRIVSLEKEIDKYKDMLVKISNNEKKKKANETLDVQIEALTETAKAYKLTIFNLERQATSLYGDIKVIENNIQNLTKKLIDITEFEKLYRKYSIYLQAMHKDGIPALIIRKKLPLINHRINTILGQSVNFKINMDILANGDIVETFYFSPDKIDTLPLAFASGAQKFISIIAIKDAFHYVSSLPKPSLSIIDEGFGTLDDELTFEIMNILNYLKNKHKNVIVITHRNEIKDFADNIIEVLKVQEGISQEVLDNNPDAGVTKLNIL